MDERTDPTFPLNDPEIFVKVITAQTRIRSHETGTASMHEN